MQEPIILKKEFIFPLTNSPKKQWRYTFKCLTCGEVDSKWYRKGSFTGICKHCSKGGYNTNTFISKSIEKYGNRYDYSKSVYVNKRCNIEVICKTHGSFFPRAGDHLLGKSGCPKCVIDNVKDSCTISLDIWKSRLSNAHPQIKLISDTTGYYSLAEFECDKHGRFEALLGNIANKKYLCPICRKVSHQKQSSRLNLLNQNATLYYVYLPKLDMYKLGVTTQKLTKRLMEIEFELLLSVSYSYSEAIELEHQLHTNLEEYRYSGEEKLLKTGSTELYTVDIKSYILRLLGLQEGDLLSKVT